MSTATAPAASVPQSTAPAIAVTAGWPVARRLRLGTVRPGGVAMTRRLFEGVGLHEGDRVVDLAPGRGATGVLAGEVNLRSWTGVCVDARAATAVRSRVTGLDRRTVVGAPDRTGLPDGEATVVMAEGLLTGLSDPSKLAVLREALRIVRPGGYVGVHELLVVPGEWGEPSAADIRAAIGPARRGGLRVLDEQGWRALVRAAGLEVVGVSLGPVAVPGRGDLPALIRAEGPKPFGQEVLRRFMQPGTAASRARAALYALRTHEDRLASAVLVARRPVMAGRRERFTR